MRRIIIKREKCKLFAIWADYWCVLDFDMDKIPPQCTKERDCIDCEEYCERLASNRQRQLFIESCDEAGNKEIIENIQAVPIKHGKTVEIDIDSQEHEMFVLFETGLIISNRTTIPAGCSDVSYSVKTEGGIVKKASITVRLIE
ncbi:MAG: hypothetical protein LBC96_04835 [Lachnospiraceae bacterium]|jgi:hypothetical protein|nr:hypothetical protein [Lachnospiraceae bacterium]